MNQAAIDLKVAMRRFRETGDAGPMETALRAYARAGRAAGMDGVRLIADLRQLYEHVFAPDPTDIAAGLRRERWVTRLIGYYGERDSG